MAKINKVSVCPFILEIILLSSFTINIEKSTPYFHLHTPNIHHLHHFCRFQNLNLFVSNIDFKVTEGELKNIFAPHGEVKSVIILKDMDDQKPKGYGFVLMGSTLEGEQAIQHLNQLKVKNRPISVQEARPKPSDESEKKERTLRPRRKRIIR